MANSELPPSGSPEPLPWGELTAAEIALVEFERVREWRRQRWRSVLIPMWGIAFAMMSGVLIWFAVQLSDFESGWSDFSKIFRSKVAMYLGFQFGAFFVVSALAFKMALAGDRRSRLLIRLYDERMVFEELSGRANPRRD